MKKAILITSFGTTSEAALQNCILPLEQSIAATYPDWDVFRCFTSQTVIQKLSVKGIAIDSMEQSLSKLIRGNYRQAVILPTLLTEGGEYEKILKLCASFRSAFDYLAVATPMLSNKQDIYTVASFIHSAYPLHEDEALLLMGHGTSGSDNESLCALAAALQNKDSRCYLASLIGEPDFSQTLQCILNAGFQKVTLAPLMLTAGTHAVKHLAGCSDSSWQNQCVAAGLTVTCNLTGLGEYPEIRELYLQHLSACIPEK